MFTRYFNLPALPVEVLLCTLEYLGQTDLRSVCLASKFLNSVATSVLYRDVNCGPERRNPPWNPLPRPTVDLTLWSPTHFTAVRRLGLCSCWVARRQPDPEHYRRLINVRSFSLSLPGHPCATISTMGRGPMAGYFFRSALRELSVMSFHDMVGTRNMFRTLKKLQSTRSMGLERLAAFDLPLLEHLEVHLVIGNVDFHIVSTLNHLRTLVILTHRCRNFQSITSLLDVLSSLPHLHTFRYKLLGRCLFTEVSARPTNLRNIRDLCLSYSFRMSGEGDDGIVQFLDLLAGTSQLERLKLQPVCQKPFRRKGEKLLSWIFGKHVQTISILRLPHCYPPLASLQRLFRTPNLKKLAVGINTATLNQLDRLLATAPMLEELSMVFSSSNTVFWHEYAKALLHQRIHSKIRVIKTVRLVQADQYHRVRRKKVAYQTRWKYDPHTDQPLRYVEQSEYGRT